MCHCFQMPALVLTPPVSLYLAACCMVCVASCWPSLTAVCHLLCLQYMTANLFFTGLLLRWDDIPKYWRWLAYINFMRYSWGALMLNQFEGDRDVQVSKTARCSPRLWLCACLAPQQTRFFLHVCALLVVINSVSTAASEKGSVVTLMMALMMALIRASLPPCSC